ncbi:AraC family transcriptional regulator [Cytophagaceae bacterium ABcell3]|nr:AraC family transcriptional regulator [Cytophagaceae bacterium ABcell3]
MSKKIPIYSINEFSHNKLANVKYQVEVFDANRHFKVEYPHRHHGFYEVLFLTKGSGKHVIDFQTYVIRPYSVFFLSPGQVHTLELSDDIKGYIFLFTSEFYLFNKHNKNRLLELPYFYHLQAETPPLYIEDPADCQTLVSLFKSACRVLDIEDQEDKEESLAALLDLILLHCKRLYPSVSVTGSAKKGRLLVKRFKQLIEENYQYNYSVRDYANMLAVTPGHLTETVKELTGRTSNQLIHERTIIEAKKLLQYTELTVTQISHELNFKDQSYFGRFFKKHTGVTPDEFRKQ